MTLLCCSEETRVRKEEEEEEEGGQCLTGLPGNRDEDEDVQEF